MKKFIAILIIFLSACSSVKKDEFVNPVFYGEMVGYYTEYDTVQITPTSYHITNFYGYKAKADCELLENTMNKVTLKCLHLPHDENNEQELIIVRPDGKPTYRTYEYIIVSEKIEDSELITHIKEYDYSEKGYLCSKDIENCSHRTYTTHTSVKN